MNKLEITELVADLIDSYHDDEWKCVEAARKEIMEQANYIREVQTIIERRLNEIDSMIQHHAIGVQNVYTEVRKVQEALKLSDVKKLLKYIENYDSARIKKEIEEIHKYMQSDFVTKTINSFNYFKYELLEVLEKDLKFSD